MVPVWTTILVPPTFQWTKYFFKKILFAIFGGHESFCGTTGTPVLDFWWCLLWVSKRGLIPHSHASLPVCNGFLRLISGATPADLLMASMAAKPFWSTYLYKNEPCRLCSMDEIHYNHKWCSVGPMSAILRKLNTDYTLGQSPQVQCFLYIGTNNKSTANDAIIPPLQSINMVLLF